MDVLYMKDRVKVEVYNENTLLDFYGVNIGETLDVELPQLEKEGYTFDGYYDQNNILVDSETIYNQNTRLDARFTKIKITSIVPVLSEIEVDSVYTKYISFNVLPSDASLVDETINYIVEDKTILDVDPSTGKILPRKDGRTTVTCVLDSDSSIQATVSLNVHLGYVKGDLDRNNLVDANDASIALEIFKSESQTQEDLKYGDMDDNGIIDANDASLILELYKINK